jgi:serine/threonine protein kinase
MLSGTPEEKVEIRAKGHANGTNSKCQNRKDSVFVANDRPVMVTRSSPLKMVFGLSFGIPEEFTCVALLSAPIAAKVDIRSDLYSLGVVLWEMVTGHVVFRGSPAEVMYQHQHAPLPLDLLEAVSQPVVVLLNLLLEKDPACRFQDPAELLKAIPTITGAIDAHRRITRP